MTYNNAEMRPVSYASIPEVGRKKGLIEGRTNIEVLGVNVGMLGKVEVLLCDENSL